MLTLTLRNLKREGPVQRTVFATNTPQVEYALTELGRDLLEPLTAVGTWVMRRQPEIVAARTLFARRGEITS